MEGINGSWSVFHFREPTSPPLIDQCSHRWFLNTTITLLLAQSFTPTIWRTFWVRFAANIKYDLTSKPALPSELLSCMNEAICHPDSDCKVILHLLLCSTLPYSPLPTTQACSSQMDSFDLCHWGTIIPAPVPAEALFGKAFTSAAIITAFSFSKHASFKVHSNS